VFRSAAANARLTALTGLALFVLLAAEGVTIPRIRLLLTPHLFIGIVLIPPVLLKLASTGFRFARYYLRDPDYKGGRAAKLAASIPGPGGGPEQPWGAGDRGARLDRRPQPARCPGCDFTP